MLRIGILALLALTGAVPASAQCLLCGGGTPAPATGGAETPAERPLRVEVTTDLDFARLVAGSGGGSVTIDSGGARRTDGNVQSLGGLPLNGRIRIEGEPGRTVRVHLPDRAELVGPNGRLLITDIGADLPPVLRLGPDGRLDVGFGGRLELVGAASGDFRGRIAVTVDYE